MVGREAIRAYWRQALTWGKWAFTLQVPTVDFSGPLAVERGKYVLKFTAGPAAPPGMPSFEDHGNYLVHWMRDADGQWRAVADAPVSEVPMQPPASPTARLCPLPPALPAEQEVAIQKRLDDDLGQVCEEEPSVKGRAIHPVLDDAGDAGD